MSRPGRSVRAAPPPLSAGPSRRPGTRVCRRRTPARSPGLLAAVRSQLTPRGLLRLAQHVFAAIGFAVVAWHLALDLSVVTSPSMSPTLQGTRLEDGDWILTEKLSYRLRRPRRWEVVTFTDQEGRQIMKRVVALPGEHVSLRDREVCIDGVPVRRPHSIEHLRYYDYGNLHNGAAVSAGDGYYVLGDHSGDSQDSRFEGPLGRDRITGRAWLIVWPLGRIGFVTPPAAGPAPSEARPCVAGSPPSGGGA
jgi:signal peptidase I